MVGLSRREREVLDLMAMGMSIPEISVHLELKYNYVKDIKRSLYRKLHANNTVEAVLNAMKWKIMPCICGANEPHPESININGQEYVRIGNHNDS